MQHTQFEKQLGRQIEQIFKIVHKRFQDGHDIGICYQASKVESSKNAILKYEIMFKSNLGLTTISIEQQLVLRAFLPLPFKYVYDMQYYGANFEFLLGAKGNRHSVSWCYDNVDKQAAELAWQEFYSTMIRWYGE